MKKFTLESIAELLGNFDMVKITKNKVELFGEIDNFRNSKRACPVPIAESGSPTAGQNAA